MAALTSNMKSEQRDAVVRMVERQIARHTEEVENA